VQIGIQLPQWGEMAAREAVIGVARAAEAAGFDSVWVSDHVVYPLVGDSNYPRSQDGSPPFRPEDGYLEGLTELAVVAGATERIGLGTSVLILPMRNVLLSAKTLATLDVLSGGRLQVAVGGGWWAAEFEALGADFANRGAVLDEQLSVLAELWAHGRGAADGAAVTFPMVVCEPRPIQPGGPPLWIGGTGPRTWRRIARSACTGWHGIGYQSAMIAAARASITMACAEFGRDPAEIRLSTATGMPIGAERIISRIQALLEAGLSQIVFVTRSEQLDDLLRVIAIFGEEVRPRLTGII
jgi:probable F420-dependent oxidoreductase